MFLGHVKNFLSFGNAQLVLLALNSLLGIYLAYVHMASSQMHVQVNPTVLKPAYLNARVGDILQYLHILF